MNTLEAASLQSSLGYSFKRNSLFRQALTHRSFGLPHNERLEFLGDSVLNCVIAGALYHRFPDLSEGDLSRLRAHLVKESTLASVAQELGLGQNLVLGEGEYRSGGQTRPSILADTLEAVIGAVFLDGSFEAAQATIERLFAPRLTGLNPQTLGKDPKTLLQEYLQARKIALPRYTVTATLGEAHCQRFEVECCIADLDLTTRGEGSSRRNAEQNAAKAAYEMLPHA